MDAELSQPLRGRIHRDCSAPGTHIVRRVDVAERLFLITSGQLSVTIERPGGSQRLATLSAGMVFGELSLIGRERRTADVYADTMVECLALDADEFEAMTEDDPALACAVLANLLRIVGRTARRMTNEVALLSA
jgi:CRP-like cAMP-binding protein